MADRKDWSSAEARKASERRLLVVDDDAALRQSLAEQLSVDGEFTVDQADSAASATLLAKAGQHHAILLDVGLPDGDGRVFCQALRAAGVRCPIIMLTGADTEADTIMGLESGASDYITKPFRFGVLLARLRAQLRQHEQSEDAVFTIGPYSFRPSAKLLTDEAKRRKIRLTEKEAAILKYLFRAGARAIRRDKLLNEVWGYNAGVTTHTLETHVYRLRQKIEHDPSNSQILVTEPGGYRLVP